jgi:hypothetical protein
VLIEENERVRVNLFQSKRYIDLNSKNLIKEEKLKILVANFEFYDHEEFFDLAESICTWEFDKYK